MKNQQEIIKLYNKGLTYKEISNKLNMPRGTIGCNCSLLIKRGLIKRRTEKTLNKKDKQALTGKIIKYYNQGLSYSKIAKMTKENEYRVKHIIAKLHIDKVIERRREAPAKEFEAIPYVAPKLEINKSYTFREKNDKGLISIGTYAIKIQGKVIEETDHFYRINTGNYIECINKNNMMHLDIKEVK